MYERFTDRARKVLQLANQEAQRFNHEYIGTEHILLGLIKEGTGVAGHILKDLDVDLQKIRLEVEMIVPSGPNMVTMGKLPMTPRAKKVIEYAVEEARNLRHNYVGTEHLLLGLVREEEGVAAQVLLNLEVKLVAVRLEVLNLLGEPVPVAADKRRQIDPTTCEREYTDEEIEFMKAIAQYKRDNRRPFPTWSEVLQVVKALGYRQARAPRLRQSSGPFRAASGRALSACSGLRPGLTETALQAERTADGTDRTIPGENQPGPYVLGLYARLFTKLTAHTLGNFLNRLLGNPH